MPQVVVVISSFSNEVAAAERTADHERNQRQRETEKRRSPNKHCVIYESPEQIYCPQENHCELEYICERLNLQEKKRGQCIFKSSTNMSQPGQEEDEQMQRPEVREEDVTEARNRLGLTGPAKSKTVEVMEECEKMGKAAPSVFSGVRSGAETVLNTRSAQPIRK